MKAEQLEITFVVGLPASGKSIWAADQANRLSAAGFQAALTDDPRGLDELEAAMSKALTEGVSHWFVTDPCLCEATALTAAIAWADRRGLLARVVYFENDPERCAVNAVRPGRENKEVAGAIRMWARIYAPPEGALSVFK